MKVDEVIYKISGPQSDFTIEFYNEGNLIGSINAGITSRTHASLSFIEVDGDYRGKGLSLIFMKILLEHLIDKNITHLELDDMSDNAEQYIPSRTRSGRSFKAGTSLYTRIGCNAVNSWEEPERICSVDKVYDNVIYILEQKNMV